MIIDQYFKQSRMITDRGSICRNTEMMSKES